MSERFAAIEKLPSIDKKRERPKEDNPVYTVDNAKHWLPAPNTLRPYCDTRPGELDMWPAYAGKNSLGMQLLLSQNKRLVVVPPNKDDIAAPKPRFLYQLEKFLDKELTALNATEVKPCEVRLQAHREVFEYLIEDFRSYRPLLSAIKNEYEMMLAEQRKKIHELEPLKQILVNVSEQCDRKIMALRDNEKEHVNDLKKENQVLLSKINGLNHEIRDLTEQVARLQEELSTQYDKYRTEYDARKILIADMNNLKYQQEDHILSQDSVNDIVEEQQDDPITLKISLKQARQDEKRVSEKLNEMIANYGDVIPRREHEHLEKKYQTLSEGYTTLNDGFQKIQMEYNALLDLQERTIDERDRYYLDFEDLKRSATPRPQWVKCAQYIEGGEEKWETLTNGKSSNEIVDVLLNEVSSGSLTTGGAQFFEGLGVDDSVPAYLQYEGPIKNRYLTKRDLLVTIMDIWKERLAEDQDTTQTEEVTARDFTVKDPDKPPFSKFVYDYLRRHFPIANMAVEWGYNIHDGIMRFKDVNDHVALFWGILNGQIDEDVYHRQIQDISLLLTHLSISDTSNASLMSKTEFRRHVTQFFSGVSEERISDLCHAAEEELEAANVEMLSYKNLFMEDDEGNTGPFLETVKQVCKEQKLSFINDIVVQLSEITQIMRDDFNQALALADPDIEADTIEKYCKWVFNDVSELEGLESDAIQTRLTNGDIWKTAHIKVFYDA